MGQASLPLFFSLNSPPIYYLDKMGGCSWGINDLSFSPYEDGHGGWYRFLVYFCVILPSFLPLFPVVLSCLIFVKILLTSRRKLTGHRSLTAGRARGPAGKAPSSLIEPSLLPSTASGEPLRAKSKTSSSLDIAHQATTTMYIVTVLYVIFNVPFWSFTLAIMFFQADHIQWIITNGIIIQIFLSRTSVVMNAACNPIVYFTRIRALKKMWHLNFKKLHHCVTLAATLVNKFRK